MHSKAAISAVKSFSGRFAGIAGTPISYRDLEQMMAERGVRIDHATIYRWVQTYAPEMEKRLRWQWRRPTSGSWRVDETCIKVRGLLSAALCLPAGQ
jgi:transposase-like protein